MAAERGIPVVLDGVVGAAGEEAGDGGPLVSVNGVRLYDDSILRRREGTVLHFGAELVAPPQTAGLAGAPWNAAAYDGPVSGAVFVHQFQERGVLLRTPRALNAIVTAVDHHCLSPVCENEILRENEFGGTRYTEVLEILGDRKMAKKFLKKAYEA